jgi:16S rRNA (uracil1498-N3)-methyltransferase
MTRRRWIADEFSNNQAALTGQHADHLVRVLRARVGQEFDVSAGNVVRRGRIVSITPDRVEFELGEEVEAATSPNVGLLLAIFKFDRMEWAIEKCTELGVSRIVPVIARRSDAHLVAAASKRTERWGRLAHQASEQSRRQSPPQIDSPTKLTDAVALPGSPRIVLAETESQNYLREVIQPSDAQMLLAVGPEGGWVEEELKLFRESGWTAASLGPTILRAETAAIAAVAISLAELV